MNLVRAMRRSADLGVREFANRVGLAHARICEYESGDHDPSVTRLQEIAHSAGLRFVPVPLPPATATAAEAADEIYELLLDGAPLRKALRVVFQLNDDLTAIPSHVLGALVAAPVPATGDVRIDALLAGLVEWHTCRRGLPTPPWVEEAARIVDPPWQFDPNTDPVDAVDEFARHGVIVGYEEWAST